MEIRFVPLELARIDTLRFEAAAMSFFEDERPLRGAPGLCDWRLCGRLSRALESGRVRGTFGEATLYPARPRLPFDKLVLYGLGAREAFDSARNDATLDWMFDSLARLRLRTFVVSLPGRNTDAIRPADAIRAFIERAAQHGGFDEVVVLDDADAHRTMLPIVEAERRRARSARELA